MQKFIQRYRLWIMSIAVVICAGTVYAQGGGTPSISTGSGIVMLIAYFLGVLAHWFKSYQMNGVTATFWAWLVKDIGSTIISLLTGVALLVAQIQTNPAAYIGTNLLATVGIFINVFLTAYAADGLNKSTQPKLPPSP